MDSSSSSCCEPVSLELRILDDRKQSLNVMYCIDLGAMAKTYVCVIQLLALLES